MKNKLEPIIEASELLAIQNSSNLVIIAVTTGPNAKELYQEKHLDNALFLDLNTQLSNIKTDFAQGGRHPLPEIVDFAHLLGTIGITSNSHVVVYDDKNGANAAARLWWMLKAIGHENVQVLNGGIQAAEKIGFPINSSTVIPKTAENYPAKNWQLGLVAIDEVAKNSENEDYLVIDVREAYRYRGESEPIDLVAGHIPGSVNVPLTTNLDNDGLFLSPSILKEKYQEVVGKRKLENTIVHCGSGVTACHTLLAMDYAGLEIPKLYVGSWSEWSRNDKNIATEL
ncbi:sulfurtransferase [Flavobacterium sp. 7A]|uniref:sulfurtransferase n=1 Tax=Flavobacterium sp. 7A TaxID=2940571 RepID=UPI002225DDB9|nr:sulfurtransferase [Flavobacterium sp. 7A]MCW2119800.1 thiosulfate/3-mercaptopyruvate sulfurtransferase [Flavobacterium sp. 7A]